MDALDTLYIMGLHEEFRDGQEWVEQNLDFGVVRSNLLCSEKHNPQNSLFNRSGGAAVSRFSIILRRLRSAQVAFDHLRIQNHPLATITSRSPPFSISSFHLSVPLTASSPPASPFATSFSADIMLSLFYCLSFSGFGLLFPSLLHLTVARSVVFISIFPDDSVHIRFCLV